MQSYTEKQYQTILKNEYFTLITKQEVLAYLPINQQAKNKITQKRAYIQTLYAKTANNDGQK